MHKCLEINLSCNFHGNMFLYKRKKSLIDKNKIRYTKVKLL